MPNGEWQVPNEMRLHRFGFHMEDTESTEENELGVESRESRRREGEAVKRRTANGERRMVNGEWRTANSEFGIRNEMTQNRLGFHPSAWSARRMAELDEQVCQT
jgi:hypothetical protein